MENKNIVMLKHHPMNVFFTNAFYVNQFESGDNPENYTIIDVTSRNKDKEFINCISPFFVGPCTASDGTEFKRFENMWQFGKVYEGNTVFNKLLSVKKKEEIPFVCSDENGNPTEEWFNIRKIGSESELAYRRPFSGKPLYHYFVNTDGQTERIDYVTSRKKVYIPEYAKLVYNTPSFKKLKEIADGGKKLALVDFDAYNYYNDRYLSILYNSYITKSGRMDAGLSDFLSINKMKDAVNFSNLALGHGFVLKMLLQNDIEVKNGKVYDNVGILE